MVNYETAHHESIIIGKYFWCILMALSTVLIWTNWKRSPVPKKWHIYLQLIGVLILVFLAIVYKGGATGESWMRVQWWGILGLIGWAYLVNALIFLFTKGNLYIMVIAWIFFNALCVLNHTEMSLNIDGFFGHFSTIYNGTIPAFTAAGIVAILIFRKLSEINVKWGYVVLMILGVTNIAYGLATRPYWGISKLQSTPSWLAICSGIGFLMFIALYYIADVKKQVNWAKIIAPAGTATLTCYMIPYFVYPIRHVTGIRLPDILITAGIGLLISLGFSLLVVVFTGWLERKGYKLKL